MIRKGICEAALITEFPVSSFLARKCQLHLSNDYKLLCLDLCIETCNAQINVTHSVCCSYTASYISCIGEGQLKVSVIIECCLYIENRPQTLTTKPPSLEQEFLRCAYVTSKTACKLSRTLSRALQSVHSVNVDKHREKMAGEGTKS